MVSAFAKRLGDRVQQAMVTGATGPPELPAGYEWFTAGHPEPNDASVAAGLRALDVARAVGEHETLVVLLSGGASALMAVPVAGLTLGEKQRATRLLLTAGADIASLNAVRKHLSSIKGGRLAAAARGKVVTLVLSDVVGDDLSVIGSGPTCPDPTTFRDALDVVDALRLRASFPRGVLDRLEAGARGDVGETPKPGSSVASRVFVRLTGSRLDALDGARLAAEALGYAVGTLDQPVVGEARLAGEHHAARLARLARSLLRPCCLLSAGETTVAVTGPGTGGRNQEFALAAAATLGGLGGCAVAASIGTDGVDGPTSAAGAVVDTTTIERARAAGLPSPSQYLELNDSYRFFEALGDLVVTGPTRTNVGDIQVVLVAE